PKSAMVKMTANQPMISPPRPAPPTRNGRDIFGSRRRRIKNDTETSRYVITIIGDPDSTSQSSMAVPKNGATAETTPSNTSALTGVLYVGCSLDNHAGSMPVRDSA